MQTIKYKLADGKTVDIEVSDEVAEVYEQIVTYEKKVHRKETRRHNSLESMQDKGFDFADENGDVEETLEREAITVPVLEQIVKNDVAEKAKRIIGHESEFKRQYLQRQADLADRNQADVKKDLKRAEKRLTELDKLIEAAFEEKVAGKIPESVCVKLIEKYTAEQTELKEKITYLTQGLEEVTQAKTDVDEFLHRLKTYFNSPTLTREMCLALFDRLVIGGKETVTGKPQEIHIYYKIDIDSFLSL